MLLLDFPLYYYWFIFPLIIYCWDCSACCKLHFVSASITQPVIFGAFLFLLTLHQYKRAGQYYMQLFWFYFCIASRGSAFHDWTLYQVVFLYIIVIINYSASSLVLWTRSLTAVLGSSVELYIHYCN